MVEEAQSRVQKSVNNLLQELDHEHLRKLQGDMHRCAANCCDSNERNLEQVHNCIENCSKDVNAAQNYIQQELSNYQDRLQRCVMQCQDKIRDKVLPSSTEEDIAKFKHSYEKCLTKCADSQVELVPSLLKRMKEILKSKKF